jgi:hypothetical protein
MRFRLLASGNVQEGIRRGSFGTRWLLLPAAGAGLYALATSGAFSRQAKDIMDQAKTRASELPDDLMSGVRQTSQKTGRSGSQGRRQASSARKTRTARKTTGSAR